MAKWWKSRPRLWTVLAVLYLGIVLVFMAQVLPTHRALVRTRVYASIDAVSVYRHANERGLPFEYAEDIRAQDYRDLSDEALIKRLHEEWGGKVDFSEIEAEYTQRVAALPRAQWEIVVWIFVVFWVYPVGAVYTVGAAIAWVSRRCRRKTP